ncbi:uncharacterized protein BT62DRAFT_1076024 [Guyanagaster necrorhizus]|uniref:HMG box domain-containing protein n=1 Tax=Guyanagaster necrorhizus TaxID=856835 RepID=A0A9P8AU24_9AGAR|nr:uncharacterized protein BT62DRAFT_1076024 [Guyanagaster necrorhizus MCA 3950]KAG7446467.1 hypothetical protein BT62DRAFT_1076024 [Guyanagaster necrorhizus MCA 3950]
MAGSSASSTKPPRPPNAWILFRSDMVRVMPKPANGASQQSVVSKAISKLWAEADPDIKREYERRAEIRKQEHAEMYPDYRFQPVKKEDKERRKEEAKQAKERKRRSGRKDRASDRYEPYPTATTSAVRTAPFPFPIPNYLPLNANPDSYGPLGPTPPMSAAPSPSENAPLEVLSDVQGAAYAQRYETMDNASSASSSAAANGIVPSMLLRSSNDAFQEPSPSSMVHLPPSPPAAATQSSGFSFSWSVHDQPTVPHQPLSLSVSMPSDEQWNDPTFDDSLEALLTSTDDPSIFSLSHFGPFPDHATLGAVALPMYDPNAFNFDFDFGNVGSQPTEDSTASNEGMLSHGSSHMTQYNLEDFINFDAYEPNHAQNLPPSPPSPELADKGAYQPPSGAALSASRRVAGSWKQPFVQGSSPDVTPLPYGVSAN